MWTRSELKSKAKDAFKRNYWKSVLVALILVIIGGGVGGSYGFKFPSQMFSGHSGNYGYDSSEGIGRAFSEFGKMNPVGLFAAVAVMMIIVLVVALIVLAITVALKALLFNPLKVGIRKFFLQNEKENAYVKEITFGFDHNYKNIVKVMFFKDLFIFLWSLLLIVPGIIKAYEYRMVDYLLTENPQMDRNEAFARSKELMMGQKWNVFVLDLSFLGWYILSMFTFGILSILYVAPYQSQTNAELYLTIKEARSWPQDKIQTENFQQ